MDTLILWKKKWDKKKSWKTPTSGSTTLFQFTSLNESDSMFWRAKNLILCHQTVCPFDDQLIRDRWSLKSESLFILNSWKLRSLIWSKLRMADILHTLQAHFWSISKEGSLVVSYLCWRMSPFILAVHSNDRYQVPNKPPDWSISTSRLFSHCHIFQSKNKIWEILGRILHILGVSLSHYHYKYMALRKLNGFIFDRHGVGGRSSRYIYVNSW